MRFQIDGKTYDARAIESLTIRNTIDFTATTAALGWPWSWGDVETIQAEIDALPTAEEKSRHPGCLMILALIIWAARLAKEPDTKFIDVLDLSVERIQFIEEPQDHKPGDAADPRRTRPASARAGSRPTPANAKRSKKTSKAG